MKNKHNFIEYQNSYVYKEENVFDNNIILEINITDNLHKSDITSIKNILLSNNGYFGIKIHCLNVDIKKLLLSIILETNNIFDITDNVITVLSKKNITHLPAMKMIRNMIEYEKL